MSVHHYYVLMRMPEAVSSRAEQVTRFTAKDMAQAILKVSRWYKNELKKKTGLKHKHIKDMVVSIREIPGTIKEAECSSD